MTICRECGYGGETPLVAGLRILRHLRPSDHRFVPVSPVRSGAEAGNPLPTSTASAAPQRQSRPAKPDNSRFDGTPA